MFIDFLGEVHYFDPMPKFIESLSQKPIKNCKYVLNDFGLANVNATLAYYPKYQSFFDRVNSCKKSDRDNKIYLNIRKADKYIEDNNIDQIDFVKIDTEGYEFEVIKGFSQHLRKVGIIQFEYGGTFLDNNVKLAEVICYLKAQGFSRFSYLTKTGLHHIDDMSDHYQYCNIVCFNEK
jgi:FkbM family methyltransferase